MFPGEIPRFIRQASFMRKSAQVIFMFRLQRGLCYYPLGVIFNNYPTKNLDFLENNYFISFTLEEGLPNHHSIQSAHFK